MRKKEKTRHEDFASVSHPLFYQPHLTSLPPPCLSAASPCAFVLDCCSFTPTLAGSLANTPHACQYISVLRNEHQAILIAGQARRGATVTRCHPSKVTELFARGAFYQRAVFY